MVRSLRASIVPSLVVLALLLPVALFAQTTGSIVGRITDASEGQSLPGVQVTISSVSLQGTKTAFTDNDGSYVFRGLPPGKYKVEAALDGFGSKIQENAPVGLDRTVTLDFALSAAVQEVITVTGGAPVVDVTQTTTGSNFSEEMIKTLPIQRTFQSLAFLSPGVVSGGLGSNPSVGGSSAAENRYIIDGLDTTDPADGTIGSTITMEFIQEVDVKTGGYEAEYSGALGGIVNMVTKSGGNELHGDVFAYYNDDGLQAHAQDIVGSGEKNNYKKYDYGFDLGGKILPDKLWYFVAVNPSEEKSVYTLQQGNTLTRDRTRNYYAGKLTWKLSSESQLVASAFGDPTTDDKIPYTTILGTPYENYEYGANSYGLTFNSTISGNFFVEAAASRFDERERDKPATDEPLYIDYTANAYFASRSGCGELPLDEDGELLSSYSFHIGCKGGGFQIDDGDRTRDNLRGSLEWFVGDHQIKGGVDYRHVKFRALEHYPGATTEPLLDSFGDPLIDHFAGRIYQISSTSQYDIWDYNQDSTGVTKELGLYLQDQWQVNSHLTFKLGVRFDSFKSEGDATGSTANLQALDFGLSDMIAPRLGVIFDPLGNGRSKIYAHYGHFYESVPLDINVRAFGHENYTIYTFSIPEGKALPTFENPGDYLGSFQFGTGTAVDPNIKAMYEKEWVIGGEYELFTDFSAGLKYIQRSIENVIEDISVDGANTYYITNPGGTVTVNPVTGETLAEPVVFPHAIRDYKAVTLTWNKRLRDSWQLAGSYTWSKNEGNYGGLYRQDNGQLDPNITSLFDLPELLKNAYGPLPNDRRNVVIAYGSYDLPFGLTTGLSGSWESGTPISKLGADALYGVDERFVTPRGSEGRTPSVWSVDLHLEYPIKMGPMELAAIADVFNITNEQRPLSVDQTWTFSSSPDNPDTPVDEETCGGTDAGCPGANKLWGTPTSYQDPRAIRFALKASW